MSLTDKTKRWLNENCNISMKGKNVLVTGANSGVGFKTAEISAYLGADVILACRSMERAKEARLKLITDNPEASISIMQLDLASLSSIEAFFEKLVSNKVDIDVFVNNAGAFRQPDKKTEMLFSKLDEAIADMENGCVIRIKRSYIMHLV